ncbi:MAG: glutaredoxin family protein [Nitrososphaerota archaeon]|nr:glutaredoxin family protein [Nitrososphaerota archaeon]
MEGGDRDDARGVVTVMSRPGCHLCEKVIAALQGLAPGSGFELRVVDIDKDPRLHERYWLEIPVVQVEGRAVFDARDMDLRGGYVKKLEALFGRRSSA